MTTVKEFKKWLDRFPDDTIVFIAIQEEASPYHSYGPINFVSPELTNSDIGDGWEFDDWTKNQFVKPDSKFFGEKHLNIGESC